MKSTCSEAQKRCVKHCLNLETCMHLVVNWSRLRQLRRLLERAYAPVRSFWIPNFRPLQSQWERRQFTVCGEGHHHSCRSMQNMASLRRPNPEISLHFAVALLRHHGCVLLCHCLAAPLAFDSFAHASDCSQQQPTQGSY